MALLLAGLTAIALCGCGAKTEMSKEDQANFKGGPPPASFTAEAEKRKAAAESHMPSNYKAWVEQRNAALKHGAPNGAAPQ